MSGLTSKEIAELAAEKTVAGAITLINRFKEARTKPPAGAAAATSASRGTATQPWARGAKPAGTHTGTQPPAARPPSAKPDDGSDVLALIRVAGLAGFKREEEE